MASTSPSALLAESLAALSKSAYNAVSTLFAVCNSNVVKRCGQFAEIESQARTEVAQAISNAQEARNERDKAVDALHTSQLEGQAWKQEVISYKASVSILPTYPLASSSLSTGYS